MASDYQKLSVSMQFARNADFNPVHLKTDLDDYIPNTSNFRYEVRKVSAATTGTTVSLAMYATVTKLIVKNREAIGGNNVVAKYRTSDGGAVDIQQAVEPQDIIVSGKNITVGNNLILTASGAAVECDVVIVGT